MNALVNTVRISGPETENEQGRGTGVLIINADDWGRNRETTDRISDCIARKTVSSVSAMIFMEDSVRAAAIALEHGVDAGLHLNFTLPFNGPSVPSKLLKHHQQVAAYLLRRRVNRAIFHPGLKNSFDYVVKAQLDGYSRLYGTAPARLDGHHHMHLCANVLFGALLPPGTTVRRNFTFQPGEKGFVNRLYRRQVDRWLARRHHVTDFFFTLAPFEPSERLQQIFSLSRNFVVEVETHPVEEDEYRYLTGDEFMRWASVLPLASHFLGGQMATNNSRVGLLSTMPRRTETFPQAVSDELKHITVCICTYKRPSMLQKLLRELEQQETDGQFSYSIVISDNDRLKSAESVVEEFASSSNIPITYAVVPEQNIALARNQAVANASGDFVAFIDDDELPSKRWLVTLYATFNRYQVEGVLGPVKRHFVEPPPKWVIDSKFYNRKNHPTGTAVHWKEGRTGNVLLKRSILAGMETVFRPEFRGGEDTDFFNRMINKGCKFIWCDEAVAYEVIASTRWDRAFLLKRALLRGTNAVRYRSFGARDIAKSVVAVPIYALGLPFAFVLGQHRFMDLAVRLCDHLGKLLGVVGINPIKEYYVTD